jgi:type VI secretion system protein ImpG
MNVDDDLLSYYQQELAYIRQIGSEFAEAHPKIAGRLRLGAKTVEDPHVARLIEAFAFLTARIRHKIEDDFPELSDSLMDVLYPDYLAPLPALSIVQFQPDTVKLIGLKTLEQNTMLATDVGYSETCFFSTRYPVELWPIQIAEASLCGQPLVAPFIKHHLPIAAVLRLSLSCTKSNMTFAELALDHLRFFIYAQPVQAYALYELLFKHTLAIAVAESAQDSEPVLLDNACLQAVGFERDENLLPYNARVSAAHRLLTEFFALPEKFLFFDVTKLQKAISEKFTRPNQKLEIFFYLNKSNTELEKNINAQYFALNCAPIINLFPKTAEPFYLTQAKTEYHLVPDAQRSPHATEIYAIRNVVANSSDGQQIEYRPLHGVKYDNKDESAAYYYAARKPAWQGEHYSEHGTEIFLSFVDLQFKSHISEKAVISADILCTNRDLPAHLPFGGDEPKLKFAEAKLETIHKIKCLTPFTPTRRPALKQGARWRLISHLALNHASFTDNEQGVAVLQNVLQLYDFSATSEHRNLLQGLLSIKSRRVVARNPQGRHGNAFWQGTEIMLEVDASKFVGVGLFLFGSILERFFALYCTINSFTQLVITTKHQGEFYRWSPRTGTKALL